MSFDLIKYFSDDPLRIIYLLGGSGGIWFWIQEWRNRIRVHGRILSEEPYKTENTAISMGSYIISLV